MTIKTKIDWSTGVLVVQSAIQSIFIVFYFRKQSRLFFFLYIKIWRLTANDATHRVSL